MIRRATLLDLDSVVGWISRDFPDADQPSLKAGYEEALSNPLNICLCAGEGGAVFIWRGPGIYEGHCFFEQRGAAARSLGAAMLGMMARLYSAKMIWAGVPEGRPKANVFLRWLGFKSLGRVTFPHGRCELFEWEPNQCPQN